MPEGASSAVNVPKQYKRKWKEGGRGGGELGGGMQMTVLFQKQKGADAAGEQQQQHRIAVIFKKIRGC